MELQDKKLLHDEIKKHKTGVNKVHPQIIEDPASGETISLGKLPSEDNYRKCRNLTRNQMVLYITVALVLLLVVLISIIAPVTYYQVINSSKKDKNFQREESSKQIIIQPSTSTLQSIHIFPTTQLKVVTQIYPTVLISLAVVKPSTSVLVTSTIFIETNCKPSYSNELETVTNRSEGNGSWGCNGSFGLLSSCNLSCGEDGYKTFYPTATCQADGKYDDKWKGCIALNQCHLSKPCPKGSTCIFVSPSKYTCQCQPGFALDTDCLTDKDLDDVVDMKDNCLDIPNSDQLDTDLDGQGDACDYDDDGDFVADKSDNCLKKRNIDKADKDNDTVGDVCDNCVDVKNTDQSDVDNDGIGDKCDNDTDNDGILNASDNCPLEYNPKQIDTDKDGVGDECDNCIHHINADQKDDNWNRIGHICEGVDSDLDGIYDYDVSNKNQIDNCLNVTNGDQVDTDDDGEGDECDDDIDGDGILNVHDNCPWLPNKYQEDADGNNKGDICENDKDGDTTDDLKDDFPVDKSRNETDFTLQNVFNIPISSESLKFLVSKKIYSHFKFSATYYQASNEDSVFGLIFAYQSNSEFYTISWLNGFLFFKKFSQADSKAGNISTLIINDSSPIKSWYRNISVSANQSYKWILEHNTDTGEVAFSLYSKDGLISSFKIFDASYKGGRIGYYTSKPTSQILLSNLRLVSTKPDNYGVLMTPGNYLNIGALSKYIAVRSYFSVILKLKLQGVSDRTCNTSASYNQWLSNSSKSIETENGTRVDKFVSSWFDVSADCSISFFYKMKLPSGNVDIIKLHAQTDKENSVWELLWSEPYKPGQDYMQKHRDTFKSFKDRMVRFRMTAFVNNQLSDFIVDQVDFSKCGLATSCDQTTSIILSGGSSLPLLSIKNGSLMVNGVYGNELPYGKFVTVYYQNKNDTIIFGVDGIGTEVNVKPISYYDDILIGTTSKNNIILDQVSVADDKLTPGVNGYFDESYYGVKSLLKFHKFEKNIVRNAVTNGVNAKFNGSFKYIRLP